MKVQEKELSGGYARIAQIMLLLFFLPFILLLIFITYNNIINHNFNWEAFSFIFIIVAISIIIIKNGFTYGDISLGNDYVTVKKLFKIKKVPISEYRKIDKALWPFTYFIEFENKQKVYFFLTVPKLFKEATSLDPDIILKKMKLEFRQLKEKGKLPTANHT